jgi:anti-sigma factor RsiW
MTHLTDRIAEYVFEELSASEMVEARRHLTACPECHSQIEQFQLTYASLKTSADVEPPRRIMFEFERPRVVSWLQRWLAPMAAAAVIALAVVHFAPPAPPQIVERVVLQQMAAQPAPPAAQPVDYAQILSELDALKKRDAAHTKEIQQVHSAIVWLDENQRVVHRQTEQSLAGIQVLSAKLETK